MLASIRRRAVQLAKACGGSAPCAHELGSTEHSALLLRAPVAAAGAGASRGGRTAALMGLTLAASTAAAGVLCEVDEVRRERWGPRFRLPSCVYVASI